MSSASQAAETAQPVSMNNHLRDEADGCEIVPNRTYWLSSAAGSTYLKQAMLEAEDASPRRRFKDMLNDMRIGGFDPTKCHSGRA